MNINKFKEMWELWSVEWHSHATCVVNGKSEYVSKYCEVNFEIYTQLYTSYEKAKDSIKDLYFYESGKLLNKYKRAAVLAFVINSASPLVYKENVYKEDFGEESVKMPDRLFLKQRLAFYIALCSIIVEYNEEDVAKLRTPIFHFPKLTEGEKQNSDDERPADDFLMSMYKGLFYSDIYHNRDILALSNIFWLLTATSELSNLPSEPTD